MAGMNVAALVAAALLATLAVLALTAFRSVPRPASSPPTPDAGSPRATGPS